ncbi:MAG: class I SAM-dependent DNA methyltransferase [Flavobacteriales bacterium]
MYRKIEDVKPWYESWFNSKYYHILYQNRSHEEAEAFIEKLFEFFNLTKTSFVVDMACGKGRHANKIAELGYKTIGLDLAEDSITSAKQNAKAHSAFFVHDMLQSPKDIFTNADIVLNLFTSFGFFKSLENHEKVIHNFGHCIKQNGLFLFDFMNVQKVINALNKEEVKTLNGIEFHITRRIENDMILKTIKFQDEGKSYEFTEEVFGLTLAHFQTMFNSANFKIIETFGDYDLNTYQPDHSSRLIILAQKQ